MKREKEQFINHYLPLQPAMQRMAESLLGNEDDAADVVQDCFVSLWNNREQLKQVVNREAWCITLVKRRCVDLLRHRRPTEEIDERTLTDNEEDNNADERLQTALRLVEKLPERQGQVVRLRHFDNLDTKTIALKMNISENNVYTLLSRAYSNLKQMITDYEKQ